MKKKNVTTVYSKKNVQNIFKIIWKLRKIHMQIYMVCPKLKVGFKYANLDAPPIE